MRESSPPSEHFLSLDALRGIAAAAVALSHVGWTTALTETLLVRNVHLFVDFFFVLSGFVIAFNYGARLGTGAQIARFAWLRFWRLYPLHFAMLLVFIAIEGLKWYAAHRYGIAANQAPFTANGPRAIITNLLLIQSFGLNPLETFNGVSWSISTEFYAYLVFALVVLAAGRRLSIAASCVVAATGVLIWRDGGSLYHTYDLMAFNRCLFGFFIGVLVFAAYSRAQAMQRLTPGVAGALCLVPIAAMVLLLVFSQSLALEFLAPLFSAAIIFVLASTRRNFVSAALSTRPMIWLGQVSYSIYMVHLAVFWAITQVLRVGLHLPSAYIASRQLSMVMVPGPLADLLLVLALAAVLLVSHLTYRLIEAPCRNWSKRVWPARPAPLARPAVPA